MGKDDATDWPALLAEAERLCRVVAPHDLDGVPLYIVRQSTLPDELGGKSTSLGFTIDRLDLYLKDFLGSRWRGRGPCMVLDDTFFQREERPDRIQRAVSAVVLHEFAHAVAEFMPLAVETSATSGIIARERLLLAGSATKVFQWVEWMKYDYRIHHPRDFGRIVIHMRHRANVRAGANVPWAELWQARGFNAASYERTLADEVVDLIDEPLTDLASISPPSEFVELCEESDRRFKYCLAIEERAAAEDAANAV